MSHVISSECFGEDLYGWVCSCGVKQDMDSYAHDMQEDAWIDGMTEHANAMNRDEEIENKLAAQRATFTRVAQPAIDCVQLYARSSERCSRRFLSEAKESAERSGVNGAANLIRCSRGHRRDAHKYNLVARRLIAVTR